MSMKEWAEREVKLACKKENPDRKDGEWDYGCACYESALKAFNSLLEDGHSGFSIGLTKNILNRLIDGKPLTPIEDTDDVWDDRLDKHDEYTSYQCKRMSGLFKDVYHDGTVKYTDIDRITMTNDDGKSFWHNGFVRRIAEEYIGEIAMPYMPNNKPYIVYCSECLTDDKNGDYDTIAIHYIDGPDGNRCMVNRYFKESKDGFVEISSTEYSDRLVMHLNRIKDKENINY